MAGETGRFSGGEPSGEYIGKFGSPATGTHKTYPSPPLAPPNAAPPPPSYALSSDDPSYRSHTYVDSKGKVHKYETVQDRLFNVVGGVFASIWRSSSTVLRADLVRPYNPKQAEFEGDDSIDAQLRDKRRRKRFHAQGWEAIDGYMGGMIQGLDRGFYGNGAQLKLMQIWKFEDQVTKKPTLPWGLNFGLGVNFQIDSGKLNLKTRLRSDHVVMRLLPRPDLELKGKWRLGNSRLGVDVRYRVPVKSPENMLQSGPGGYLAVRLFNWEGAGFSLSPDGGLEFDEQVVRLYNNTSFRVAAKLAFPRYFPKDDNEDPITVEFRRLGVKTVLG